MEEDKKKTTKKKIIKRKTKSKEEIDSKKEAKKVKKEAKAELKKSKKQTKTEQKKVKKEKKVSFSLTEVIVIIVITALVVSVFSAAIVYNNYEMFSKTNINNTSTDGLNEFIKSYNHIINSYVNEVDKQGLIESAIKGMYNYLDDAYSVYVDSESNETLTETLEGKYEGLGIEITMNEDNQIIINRVFDSTPAKEAGLQSGDIILKVDDIDLEGKTHSYLSDYIKNNTEKSTFTIVYLRDGEETTVTIERKMVLIEQVTSEVYDNVGYVSLETFSLTAAEQIEKRIKAFPKNVDSLIIDVRDNSGGYLNSAFDVASLFVGKGKIVYQTKDKNEKIEKKYCTTDPIKEYKKIVVLTNENSASASEILTAALKENIGALSVGTKTFGKGTVQETEQLSSGAMVKYTSAYWLTPNGNCINKEGIEADYEVYNNYETEEDEQLLKAIEVIKELSN